MKAREFLLASIDEGVDLQLDLGRSSAPWVSLTPGVVGDDGAAARHPGSG
jgi:hypothetical protein